MEEIWKHAVLPERMDGKWIAEFLMSLVLPLLILLVRPIGLDLRQSTVVAAVVLAIIWWSSGIVKKIPAAVFLLAAFFLTSGTGYKTVFAFPLSETFPMLVITYLFSRAISNAGIIDKIFSPVLQKVVHTPFECLLAAVVSFYLTMYVIPQPLARLIIVAAVFDRFLKKAGVDQALYSAMMYGVFLFYAVVNMSAKDADMIMNHVAADFAGGAITNGMWMKAMFVPTLFCCVLILLLFMCIFHRQLAGKRIRITDTGKTEPFTAAEKQALIIVVITVLLWVTQGIHGINNTLISLISTILLFGIGILHKRDLNAIDVTTLIFLTAAFSIGGVMKACGAADKVFGLLQGIFPAQLSPAYFLIMVLAAMLLHMVLGSNTTTLSVVVPGMILLCGNLVPQEVIVYIAIVSVSFHAVLPFHSVSLMIGSSDGYFPPGYVTRLGVPLTALVYLSVLLLFLPYWHLIGLL
ncbi:MAG: anion permease [Eubacteriales bacterium]|nr:anion permease [Eubacteriales bacterium]